MPLIGRDNIPVVFAATVVLSDGRRVRFVRQGYDFSNRELSVLMQLNRSPGDKTATEVLLSANVPVDVERVAWWNGDPSKRMEWP